MTARRPHKIKYLFFKPVAYKGQQGLASYETNVTIIWSDENTPKSRPRLMKLGMPSIPRNLITSKILILILSIIPLGSRACSSTNSAAPRLPCLLVAVQTIPMPLIRPGFWISISEKNGTIQPCAGDQGTWALKSLHLDHRVLENGAQQRREIVEVNFHGRLRFPEKIRKIISWKTD